MFQAVESELGDGVRVISQFFSTYPSLFVPALLAAADCSIIDYNLPRSIKANLMVMISPLFFFLVRSPRDFSDNLLNNGWVLIYVLSQGCLYLLFIYVYISCSLLLIAL